MRILILDDLKGRHEIFDLLYRGNAITHCYNYHEFFTQLHNQQYELISLDHDLGEFCDYASTYTDGWGNIQFYNGSHAANEVCTLEDSKLPMKVIVHSINPVGAKKMVDILTQRGIPTVHQPFSDTTLF